MKKRAEPILTISKKDKPQTEVVAKSTSNKPKAVVAARLVREEIPDAVIQDKYCIFWEIIATFGWKNVNDGEVEENKIIIRLNRLRRSNDMEFFQTYTLFYDQLLAIARGYGIDITDTVISHIIALGQKAFETISASESLILFMIESGECRDFHQLVMRGG